MATRLEQIQAAVSDRYRVDRQIGAGGMATVFLAHDRKHDRRLAVKVLNDDLAATVGAERFLREVSLAARLSHPHVLPVYESGERNGLLFYFMPFIEGESLRDRLTREGQLPIEEALRIAADVGDALGYAHRKKIVHRDVKPENILLSHGEAMITDFGIARVLGSDTLHITATGVAVGTPGYMSPEQTCGEPVDARSDIYSLGCVLYEMLAGGPPFTGTSAQAVAARHMVDAVPPIRTVRESVSARVSAAIEKALAKAPGDRFPSARKFVAELRGPTGFSAWLEEQRRQWREFKTKL